jgi:hypothetical protein
MKLYHYTSIRHLRGLAEHALTVGDVPTDLNTAVTPGVAATPFCITTGDEA